MRGVGWSGVGWKGGGGLGSIALCDAFSGDLKCNNWAKKTLKHLDKWMIFEKSWSVTHERST